MIQTGGKFYIGRDAESKAPVLYDPDDLTTHAVVVGMTGSGKTGLCIGLLEEAALNNIPALMIDPKGDITNALLHFPDLLPEDFQPWLNADVARREGKTIEQAAAEEAGKWQKGLAADGIDKERILALKNAAHFAIYTPGSDAGIPISILASLQAPDLPWQGNEEILREKIGGTVTAILGLVGMEDIDPVRSREHILLANIFERAWSAGKNLDLGELILQTQNPPFEKLGVFDLNTFFPEKERFSLAMLLNNILAAPAFQTWITGQPLDVPALLHGPDGRPRHSVFYVAHLSDSERMFFITLLYSAVETWMRSQKGSTSLRALLYFDEIFGYMPPTSNPPTKPLMLRMLKQARAFGVGQVLATQNPVDVDYKALSNAGTWMIGRLQTERDKERLLDGLEGAAGGDLDRGRYDAVISKLGKRIFLLHNVHAKGPQVFGTRWAMNYLAGPLTRAQIPALNELAGAAAPAARPTASAAPAAAPAAVAASAAPTAAPKAPPAQGEGSATRPSVPTGVPEYFLPNNLTLMEAFAADGEPLPPSAMSKGLLYHPALLAQSEVRFFDRKYSLDSVEKRTALVFTPDRRGVVRWEDYPAEPVDARALESQPVPQARFEALEGSLADGKLLKALEADFVDWVFRTSSIKVYANNTLKVFAGPPTGEGQFRQMLGEAARKGLDAEKKKLQATYKTKIQALQKKLNAEKRELMEDQSDLQARKVEALGTHAENIVTLFTGSRSTTRLSRSLSKHRMVKNAEDDVEESIEEIDRMERELAELSDEIEDKLDEIEERWANAAREVEEIPYKPLKKDVLVELFGVAWVPYHQVEVQGKTIEVPGYGVQ
ncbi:MAG: DUF87 domain-containing protein [Chloroflexi bacterium]|nr:DUF87 domain-containing protein [Chloroflexota bacterium]